MASLARTILEEHLTRGELVPGQEIAISVDQTLVQDATGTMAMMQFELFGHDRVEVETAVVYVDHNILQIDFKNPDDHRFLQAMAAKYGVWFSRPGNGICHYIHCERFAVPGKTLIGADSHTTQSGSCGMIAIGAGGLDVAVVHGGPLLRASLPEDRRRLPRERAPAALDPGEGRDPRAAAPARRARRPRGDLRVHRAGCGDAQLHRARDDLQHDRRARRDGRDLPVRRRDEALARGAGARGGLRRARDRRHGRLRRGGADRPRRARPARREAVEPGQRRAGRGGRGNGARAGLHRLLGQLVVRGPGARRRRPARQRDLREADLGDRDARALARSSTRSRSRARTST